MIRLQDQQQVTPKATLTKQPKCGWQNGWITQASMVLDISFQIWVQEFSSMTQQKLWQNHLVHNSIITKEKQSLPTKNKMWWLNIVSLAFHRSCRRRLLSCNISNLISSKIMIQLRRSNLLQEIKLMAPISFNIHQARFMLKNGWEQNTQLCSG